MLPEADQIDAYEIWLPNVITASWRGGLLKIADTDASSSQSRQCCVRSVVKDAPGGQKVILFSTALLGSKRKWDAAGGMIPHASLLSTGSQQQTQHHVKEFAVSALEMRASRRTENGRFRIFCWADV